MDLQGYYYFVPAEAERSPELVPTSMTDRERQGEGEKGMQSESEGSWYGCGRFKKCGD